MLSAYCNSYLVLATRAITCMQCTQKIYILGFLYVIHLENYDQTKPSYQVNQEYINTKYDQLAFKDHVC